MTTGRKVLIGTVVIAVLGTAGVMSVQSSGNRGIEVRLEEVELRNLVETVTASGNIRAGRVVDISSDVSARVAELHVEEGDDVEEGELLLVLDQTQFKAAVDRAEASVNQARAQAAQQRSNLERAERDLDRLERLFARDSLLLARQQLEDARTERDLAVQQLESFQFGVEQAVAALEEQQERLSKTVFTSPISGKVTRLNVEVGETVIIGTMNNAGSLVLTVSELSRVEAVVQVDETDIPYISLGDSAVLELDAFPDQRFAGVVTEIGNSAMVPPTQSSSQSAAIDFEVVITMADPPGGIRPDLSTTADIITATASQAVSVPIIALTVRSADGTGMAPSSDEDDGTKGIIGRSGVDDVEGVFVVRDGIVEFVRIEVGITGQEHFEVLSGLSAGDVIVAGPYQRIRDLESGDAVRAEDENRSR